VIENELGEVPLLTELTQDDELVASAETLEKSKDVSMRQLLHQ